MEENRKNLVVYSSVPVQMLLCWRWTKYKMCSIYIKASRATSSF